MTPSLLQKLREWLTLDETALELSEALSIHASDADVLRLVLDGHLSLSLYLPVKVKARCRRINDDSLDPEETSAKVEGICDVPIFGRGKVQVEYHYQRLLGHFLPRDPPVGAFVEKDEMLCRLPPDEGATGMSTRAPSEFPQGSILCIRRAALEDFVQTQAQKKDNVKADVIEKPLRERERATLLTIIAALAGEAKIDISKPSKAAESIETLTTNLGARLSARSIEDHLKRIPDAIERKGGTAT